ncbi:MAG: 1-deoxy-D-xylulose-5-phosphate reductoisomerase [Clostridia bacterium]|nr:1-deoxy-D-xylulose-5-phosphate reductoisomerase [Clostridia bacterium]
MNGNQKKIAILGATGSVGRQAASVAASRAYSVDLLTAGSDLSGLLELCSALSPRAVAIADENKREELREALSGSGIRIYSGAEGILEAIADSSAEVFINSILGEAGLMPTLEVIKRGSRLALANKESLVIAGDIVMNSARESGSEIIPVDSEHSAIFQSLKAGRHSEIKKILLTASGGPFYGKSAEELSGVTLADTLAHPTWKMGRKITVDSATLMNKGFELIEAVHLFGVAPSKVEVIIHRESILHSAVEYIDNTVIGELSSPDMRSCVQYAVDYPDRCESATEPLDLIKLSRLTFAAPDREAFPLLSLASDMIEAGGAMPAVMNAADEVAVAAFLEGKIGFTDISKTVISTTDRMYSARSHTSLPDIITSDREARIYAREAVCALAKQSI